MDRDNNRGMRDWLIFIRTAETGSISGTARQLNISTAAVSKAVRRLENYLDAALFSRLPQGMSLTETGLTTLNRAREITESFHSLLADIRNPENEIKGHIRLTAPAIVCEFLANEWGFDYAQMHPKVKVFIDARERSDLSRESPELDDLVLRSGKIESADLVHRKLSPLKLVLCASPRYLQQYPAITHPRDLENHQLLGLHHHGLAGPLLLFKGDESYSLEWDAETGISSNNLLGMLNLAIQGRGISVPTPGWLASGYLEREQLDIILPEWNIPDLPVWLIWRQRPRQTRIFTDFCNYIEERWNTRPQLTADAPPEVLLQPNFMSLPGAKKN